MLMLHCQINDGSHSIHYKTLQSKNQNAVSNLGLDLKPSCSSI